MTRHVLWRLEKVVPATLSKWFTMALSTATCSWSVRPIISWNLDLGWATMKCPRQDLICFCILTKFLCHVLRLLACSLHYVAICENLFDWGSEKPQEFCADLPWALPFDEHLYKKISFCKLIYIKIINNSANIFICLYWIQLPVSVMSLELKIDGKWRIARISMMLEVYVGKKWLPFAY